MLTIFLSKSFKPKTSKLHDVPDVLRCVHLARAVSPVHCQLRNSPGVEREAVCVRDVPVEHVELVVGHPGDDLLDDLQHKKDNDIKINKSRPLLGATPKMAK